MEDVEEKFGLFVVRDGSEVGVDAEPVVHFVGGVWGAGGVPVGCR